MNLARMPLEQFSEVVASNTPVPGGSSAAAVAGALGVALTNMVANLTIGKKDYLEHTELMKEIIEKADSLRIELLKLVDKNTEDFNAVNIASKMPKETEEERNNVKQVLQEKLKNSATTPYGIMELGLKSLEITECALGSSNVSMASDLGVAALALKTAVQGAWLSLLVSLGEIEDKGFANNYQAKGKALLEQAIPLADKIYDNVLEKL